MIFFGIIYLLIYIKQPFFLFFLFQKMSTKRKSRLKYSNVYPHFNALRNAGRHICKCFVSSDSDCETALLLLRPMTFFRATTMKTPEDPSALSKLIQISRSKTKRGEKKPTCWSDFSLWLRKPRKRILLRWRNAWASCRLWRQTLGSVGCSKSEFSCSNLHTFWRIPTNQLQWMQFWAKSWFQRTNKTNAERAAKHAHNVFCCVRSWKIIKNKWFLIPCKNYEKWPDSKD